MCQIKQVELKQIINPASLLKTDGKKHVFLPPYQPPELSWLNIKAIAELHCVERCQIFWLKYEKKCKMKQKNQREVLLCIYLQYINFLVHHSYADIIALLIILESYVCNYFLYMIYVNKVFSKNKETKNKGWKVFYHTASRSCKVLHELKPITKTSLSCKVFGNIIYTWTRTHYKDVSLK